jgi:ketosteroid isomerase-like protein
MHMRDIRFGAALAALALLIFSPVVWARQSPAAATEAAVRALEAKRTAAMVKADVASLATLLGDDLSYVHSSGVTDTKASFIGLLKSGDLKYRSIAESDVKVRVYGDLALLTGRALMVSKRATQDEASHDLYFTSVWAKTGGAWHFVAWQSTTAAAK